MIFLLKYFSKKLQCLINVFIERIIEKYYTTLIIGERKQDHHTDQRLQARQNGCDAEGQRCGQHQSVQKGGICGRRGGGGKEGRNFCK